MTITTCVFDAYGTLFDVVSAARNAAKEPAHKVIENKWPMIARDWRHKQLQYTWLRAIAGQHCDFWEVTQDSLDWALEASQVDAPATRDRLLDLYWELDAYPEAPPMLAALRSKGLKTAILSNGAPNMLQGAVTSAGLDDLLDATLSVEEIEVYKPHQAVYGIVNAHFDCKTDEVLFVSSNGWDVAGAALYGFKTVWVNRGHEPRDRLFADPHHVLHDLTTVPDLIRA